MKAQVRIEFEVDSDEYYATPSTIQGIMELVNDMFETLADFPDRQYRTVVINEIKPALKE